MDRISDNELRCIGTMQMHDTTLQLYLGLLAERSENVTLKATIDALLEIAEQCVDTRTCSKGILRAMNDARLVQIKTLKGGVGK